MSAWDFFVGQRNYLYGTAALSVEFQPDPARPCGRPWTFSTSTDGGDTFVDAFLTNADALDLARFILAANGATS